MDVGVLGDIRLGGDRVRGRVARRVVACLVANRGHPLATGTLVDAVWGDDPPERPEAALANQLSRLRALLGGELARWNGSAYDVVLDGRQVDLDVWSSAVLEARRCQDATQRLVHLDAAERCWGGPPYAELGEEWFVLPDAGRLRALRDEGVRHRLESLAALGRHDEVVAEGAGLVLGDCADDAVAVVARSLAATGRARAALARLEEHRRCLREHAGLEAGPAIRDAEADIAAGSTGSSTSAMSAVGAVGAVLDSPSTSGSQARTWTGSVRTPRTIVGRARQRLEIEAVLSELGRREPVAIRVRGPLGSGRTRLVEEVVAHAARRGVRIATVRGTPGLSVPLRAVTELARGIGVDRPTPAQPADGPSAALGTVVHELAEALARSLTTEPTIVVIDDEDAVDPASLEVLTLLSATRLLGRHVAPVALLTTADLGHGGSTRNGAQGALPVDLDVVLEPLDDADVEALIGEACSARVAPGLVDAAHAASGGLPLAVLDGLRTAAAQGVLRMRGDHLQLADHADPDQLFGAHDTTVVARVADLDDIAAHRLATLAVLRPGLDVDRAALLADLAPEEVLDAMDLAERAGIAGVRRGRVEFFHPSYRQAIAASLTEAARVRIHRTAVRQLGQPLTDEEVVVLAWHLRHTGTTPTPAERDLQRRAGDLSFAASAWADAVDAYDHGADQRRGLPAELCVRAGEAAARAHRHEASISWFETGRRRALADGDVIAAVANRIGLERERLTSGVGTIDVAALAQDAATVEPLDAVAHARACTLLAEIHFASRDLEAADRWTAPALASAEASGDPEVVAEAGLAAGLLAIAALDVPSAESRLERAEVAATAADAGWIHAGVVTRRALTALLSGHPDLARRSADAVAVCEANAALANLSLALAIDAAVAAPVDPDEALRRAIAAERAWHRTRYRFSAPLLFPIQAACWRALGQPDAAAATIDRWASSGIPGSTPWRLHHLAACDDVDGVHAQLRARPLVVVPLERPGLADLALAAIAVRVGATVHDADLREAGAATLAAARARGIVAVPGSPTSIDAVLSSTALAV